MLCIVNASARRSRSEPAAWRPLNRALLNAGTADTTPHASSAENQPKPNQALAEMERALLAELDSTKFLPLLVESGSRRFDALTGVWLVVGDDLLVERITSVPGTFPEGRMAFGEGMSGRCAATRHGLLISDYPRWEHAVPRYVTAGLRHAMAQPLMMGDHLLGVLTMSRTGDDAAPFSSS